MSSTDFPNGAAPPPPTRLNGWKEIAAYFGKGVRTVQRWEKELGLPVHRIGSAAGEIVYALPPELDRWQRSAAGKGIRDAAAVSGENHEPAPVAQPAPQPEPPLPPATSGPWRLRRATLLVLLGVVGLVAARSSGFGACIPPRRPAGFVQDPNKALVIYDADGRFLWEHPSSSRSKNPRITQTRHSRKLTPVSIRDIDGDGGVEVLFVSEPWTPDSRGLFCFDKPRQQALSSRAGPRGQVRREDLWPAVARVSVLATGVIGQAHDIWFVSTHLEEFPTVLEARRVGQREGDSEQRPDRQCGRGGAWRPPPCSLVPSTTSQGASLAVLDARDPSGAAPAVSDHYRCTGCPPGAPGRSVVSGWM
jgi:hypothetical protein